MRALTLILLLVLLTTCSHLQVKDDGELIRLLAERKMLLVIQCGEGCARAGFSYWRLFPAQLVGVYMCFCSSPDDDVIHRDTKAKPEPM